MLTRRMNDIDKNGRTQDSVEERKCLQNMVLRLIGLGGDYEDPFWLATELVASGWIRTGVIIKGRRAVLGHEALHIGRL